ncbi:MAG: DNA translocase FtsK, partial [Isosphaeraceae bacterium]
VAAGLLDRFAPDLWPSPPVGSGGYVGALLATFLFSHFGPYGMLLIMLSAAVLGLILCHEAMFAMPFREISAFARGCAARVAGTKLAGPRPGVPALGDWPATGSVGEVVPAALPALGRPTLAIGPAAQLSSITTTDVSTSGATSVVASRTAGAIPAVDPGAPFVLPPRDLLEPPAVFPVQDHETQIHARAMLLERTLLDFGYQVRVVQIDTGPVITQFEIELEAGLRVSRIMSLADDLAIALAVPSVRIVAPIPGK